MKSYLLQVYIRFLANSVYIFILHHRKMSGRFSICELRCQVWCRLLSNAFWCRMPSVSDDVRCRMSLSASLSLPDLTFLSHWNLIPFGQGFHSFLFSFTVVGCCCCCFWLFCCCCCWCCCFKHGCECVFLLLLVSHLRLSQRMDETEEEWL